MQPPSDNDSELVTIELTRAAARRLGGVVLRTPLLPFGRATGPAQVYVKPESLQATGSFKLRGAYNALASLPASVRARGVVAHSSGNHAQGIARAAALLGVRAVIFMPSTAPTVKIDRVRADGAEVVLVGPASEERARRAKELAEREGMVLIPSSDDAAVIAGQGTIGLEIVEQLAELSGNGTPSDPAPVTVLVPIGGGGVAAGVSSAVKALNPAAQVFGVEPALAADAKESLGAGRIVTWPSDDVGRTIADGMRLSALGALPFRHLKRFLDDVVLVEDDEIRAAMARAAWETRLVLEPSGAATLAAALFHRDAFPSDRPIVCVLSGGNIDPDRYLSLVAAPLPPGATG
jgi:threo-3-hydroxy-L-aspartate ammonia-lyase